MLTHPLFCKTSNRPDLFGLNIGIIKIDYSVKSFLIIFGIYLKERIKKVAEQVGGLNQLAKLTGITRITLGRQLLEGADPKLSILLAISKVTGCSFEWLATGEGEMFTDAATAPSSARTIDTEVLMTISGAVEDVYRSLGQYPSKKFITGVAADIYNAMLTADEPTDFTDPEMLKADIAAHMARLKRRIINGEINPGRATA